MNDFSQVWVVNYFLNIPLFDIMFLSLLTSVLCVHSCENIYLAHNCRPTRETPATKSHDKNVSIVDVRIVYYKIRGCP